MPAYRTIFFALNCVALSFWVTVAHGQSALPNFSNPYGGAATLIQSHAPQSPTQKSAGRTAAKHMRRRVVSHKLSHKFGHKQPVTTNGLTAADLSLPTTISPPQTIPHDTAMPQTKDNALDFGLQWSAADDPHYSTTTSTIPALNEIKSNTNETPPETGSSIEAGMKLKF